VHIRDIDLNLLRLFDAVYRAGSVSVAAESLDLTQPAASQGLSRLRRLLDDPLFVRAAGGVQPTPRAQRLAEPVRLALAGLERALNEGEEFNPTTAQRVFRLHLSDIGEARFLPDLMETLRQRAPGVRVESFPLPRHELMAALDEGKIDFAVGFLPDLRDAQRLELLQDHYVVLLRDDHPFAQRGPSGQALLQELAGLEFVAVRTHADTLRILNLLQLTDRLRLVTEHFMVLPSIVQATDLAAVVPKQIAEGFAGRFVLLEPDFPLRNFTVSLHWSKRFEGDPARQWLHGVMKELFRE